MKVTLSTRKKHQKTIGKSKNDFKSTHCCLALSDPAQDINAQMSIDLNRSNIFTEDLMTNNDGDKLTVRKNRGEFQ